MYFLSVCTVQEDGQLVRLVQSISRYNVASHFLRLTSSTLDACSNNISPGLTRFHVIASTAAECSREATKTRVVNSRNQSRLEKGKW